MAQKKKKKKGNEKKKTYHPLYVYLLSPMDVVIDGKALQNPGCEGLKSNQNQRFSSDKQLGTH